MKRPQRLGGSFAPPINSSTLSKYGSYINSYSGDPQVKEACEKLHKMVEVFQQTPSSTQPKQPHQIPAYIGADGKQKIPYVQPLDEAEIKRIWDYVPWDNEIKMYQKLFDELPNGTTSEKDFRNMAFHLLWFAVELEKDREPVTNDLL